MVSDSVCQTRSEALPSPHYLKPHMTELNILAFVNVGPQEMMIILVIVLLLFGAKKIPELARGMGKGLGEFKKAKDEFEHEITRAADEASSPAQTTANKESQPRPQKDSEEG